MKPAWDQLMTEFKDSKTGLVADVDCTKEEELCGQQKVEGYPTIKWGKIGELKDYEGERELSGLQKFAKNNLGPVCGPKSLSECDETQKKQIEEFMKLDDAALKAKMVEKEKAVEALEKAFEKEVAALEAAHQLKEDAKNAKVKAISAQGLGAMSLVWKERYPPPPPPPPEEEDHGDEGEQGQDGEDPDGADGDDEGMDGDEPAGGRGDEL